MHGWVANDHFAWRSQGFYSQPLLARKRVRSQKEKEKKKKKANMDYNNIIANMD